MGLGLRQWGAGKHLGLLVLLCSLASPFAWGRAQVKSYEDALEFFQPAPESKEASRTASVPGLDSTLQGTGTWSYHFLYVPRGGNATEISTYRAQEKIKPASVLKLFTGFMAYETQAQPVDYLHFMLRRSDNERAQATLDRMGGPTRLRAFYADRALKLDSSNFTMVDGSGLSHSNQVTALLVTQLLGKIHRSGHYDAFKRLLAQPQEDGTLVSRFPGVAYPMYAKTGTLYDTASLAGFVDLNHGTLIFAILSNQLKITVDDARGLIDRMVVKTIARAQSN